MADMLGSAGIVHHKPEICRNLAEDSELNPNVVGTELKQVSSSFSCTQQHFSQPGTFVAQRQPGIHAIQSVEDFTVNNYFGFDEESEDDLHLPLPPVKMVPSLKPIISVPFPVSSTPNLKASFTRPQAKPLRLINEEPNTRTALMSKPAPYEVSLISDMVNGSHTSSTPIMVMDENVPVQNFMKPPRRSYERAIRLCQQSHYEGESLNESEERSKKQTKRNKKTKIKEERIIKKWAANVQAHFSEIESFELCVE